MRVTYGEAGEYIDERVEAIIKICSTLYHVPWAVYLEKSTYELNTHTLWHFL